MKVGVIGAGYVGLVTAACLADHGHDVSVVEASRDRVRQLEAGDVPFHEPGLAELFRKAKAAARLEVTDAPTALADVEVILVCVGTPLAPDGEADLSQVEAACATIRAHAPNCPVVVRSTLPLGSTGRLQIWLGRPNATSIATNPEFLRQGSAIADFQRPARIVIGSVDGSATPAAEAVRALYADVSSPIILANYATAEMIKNAANAFLATKLSFVNEIADLSEAFEADIDVVVKGIGLDPRIGETHLRPGIGFGGSCLPKELANLVRLGQRHGLAMPLLASAGHVNDGRATQMADRLEGLYGALRGVRVAILGLAFKPNTDDLRYSPAVSLAERLIERGARVVAHDPVVGLDRTLGIAGLERVAEAGQAIASADLVVLATEWDDYQHLPWEELAEAARTPFLFDGRNALDHDRLRRAGWRVAAVGHASPSADG
jgi:UDPglucose 6-dehydrogenase